MTKSTRSLEAKKLTQEGDLKVVHKLMPVQTDLNCKMNKRKRTISIDYNETLEEKLKTTVLEEESVKLENQRESLFKILNNVNLRKDIHSQLLKTKQESGIKKIVSELEVEHVKPLIRELVKKLGKANPQNNLIFTRWLRCIVNIHRSYISANPEINQLLNPLKLQMEVQMNMAQEWKILEGKLDCVLTQFINPKKYVDQDDEEQVSDSDSDESMDADITQNSDSDYMDATMESNTAEEMDL